MGTHTKRKGRGPFFFSLFSFSLNGLWFRLPSAKTCVSCGLRNSLRVDIKMGAKCFLRIVVSMPLFTNAGSLKTPDSQLFSSKSTPSRDHKKKGGQPKKKTMTFTNVIGFLVGKKKKKKKNFFFFFFWKTKTTFPWADPTAERWVQRLLLRIATHQRFNLAGPFYSSLLLGRISSPWNR